MHTRTRDSGEGRGGTSDRNAVSRHAGGPSEAADSAADLKASPLPPAPSVIVDRSTADMDVCCTG